MSAADPIRDANVTELVRSGLSDRNIAEKLGLTNAQVGHTRRRLGLLANSTRKRFLDVTEEERRQAHRQARLDYNRRMRAVVASSQPNHEERAERAWNLRQRSWSGFRCHGETFHDYLSAIEYDALVRRQAVGS